MLEDTPRKLLRIIFQFQYHFKRMPNIKELGRLSGRRPADIYKGFKALAAENYIQWNTTEPIETAFIITGWERDIPYDISPQQGVHRGKDGNNIDYWLYH